MSIHPFVSLSTPQERAGGRLSYGPRIPDSAKSWLLAYKAMYTHRIYGTGIFTYMNGCF